MENMFLFEFATPIGLLWRFLAIIGISVFILWLFITVYMHYFYKEEKQPFTLTWKFSFLKSIIFYVLLFSVYFFFLIKINGIHWFDWMKFPLNLNNIYFLISPEILIFLGAIALFYYQKFQINKLIK